MLIPKWLIWTILIMWGTIWCFAGLKLAQYQIVKKPNYDGTFKPASCEIELKVPKIYCAGTDENGITFYYNNIVNRLYLQ